MKVIWISWQAATRFDWLGTSRQDGNAIPALLPVPDCAVASLLDRIDREALVRRLQFLQADGIWLGLF